MESIDFYNEIGRVLGQNESIRVLAAVRTDPLVWETLQQLEFLVAALDAAGSQVECWNPGHLALFMVGNIKPETLRAEPMLPLGHALQEKVLRAYQATQRSTKPPLSLSDAGLLALALRERRRLTGTWSGLLQEILPRPAQADAVFHIWRSALACLYAIVPDPLEMLRALMPKSSSRVPLDWVVLAQFSQPFDNEEHIQSLTQVLKGQPVPLQLGSLRSISLHGREEIASAVAGRLLVGHPTFAHLHGSSQAYEQDLTTLSSRALSLQQLGSFYQLAGDHRQALSLFSAAETSLKDWLAGLYLQCLNMRTGENLEEAGVMMDNNQLSQLASAAGWLQNDLGVALANHPYASSILDQIPEETNSAFLAVKRAALTADSEPALARDIARRAAQELLEQTRSHSLPFRGEFLATWRPQETLNTLLSLGLKEEALSLSKALVKIRPVDQHLLNLYGRILEKAGHPGEALKAQQIAVALDPENPEWRRPLARMWSQMGDWERSFVEWQKILSLTPEPEVKDRLACAQAALQSGALLEARTLSEDLLAEDENNGAALGILGQALLGLGETQTAANYLARATLLSPEVLAPWLALAELQEQAGEPHHALETLRAAVTALPDESGAHLAYGEACSREGALSEALTHFKQAYHLSPESTRASLLYGRALRRLGHSTEARTVLEKVRPQWSGQPDLAYEYAQVLLDLNDAEAALPVLEAALRNGLPVLEGSLLYAKILLGEYRSGEQDLDAASARGRMEQADIALQRILEIDPDNLEARFLSADILREKGNLEEALVAYRQLADLPAKLAHDFGWRIQWGMARTALSLNQIDIAIAAYKEACLDRPESMVLRRGLAEALLLADLPQEALESANDALELSPDNVDNLAWYAGFAARLGENKKAVAALERAVQINPLRPDLLVNLAQWQLSAGDLEAARTTLQAILQMDSACFTNQQATLRRAAHMYLRMEDQESALVCFEHALAAWPVPEPGLCFEVAELQSRMGKFDRALELAQKAQEENPKSLPVYMLQADLLTHLNRPQAALAVLEHALRIIEDQESGANLTADQQNDLVGEIHERFTRILVQEGNLPSALYHAEKAFALHPKRAGLAYRAANLAYSMLQNDRAKRILEESLPDAGPLPQVLLEQGKDGLDLLCLHIEAALASGQNAVAQDLVEGGWALAPQTPRLLAAEVRLLARQGNDAEARKVYESVVLMLQKMPEYESEPHPLWLAEAALESQLWQEALESAEKYALKHGSEAQAHLFHARIVVEAAEQQRLCAAVGCTVYGPGPKVLDAGYQEKFNAAIDAASHLASGSEISRWEARGRAVFTPTTQTARVLAQMPADAGDVAALIAALRQLNNRAAAMQVSRKYPQDGKVLLQLALCYLSEDSLEGLAVAEQAAHALPTAALAHAAAARLAEQVSAINRAVESYAKAIEIWPMEPVWHDAAGDLFVKAGNFQQAGWHRKQAFDLSPDSASYAYKLGQALLAQGDVDDSVEYLERSTVLDPQQPEVWIALASAYHMCGRLPQAMEAAKRAGSLNPSSAEGLLIAGETALALHQVDQALTLAKDAVRREPENAGAVLFLCGILSQQGRHADSLALLEAAPPVLKKVFSVGIERTRLIHKIHGPQAAREVLEKMVKDHPDETDLLSFLARVLAECGDVKAAEKYAHEALRINPDQPDLALMLGRLQRKTGQLDQAIHHLGEAIRVSPDHLDTYLEMASVYQERREYIHALQVFGQAIHVAPDDYRAYYQSGLILRDNKDYAAAETMLRKAADLAPDNLSIRRQLVGVIALNLVHSKPEVSIP